MSAFSYFAFLLFLIQAAILPAAEFDLPENTVAQSGENVARHGNQNYVYLRRNQGQSIATTTSYTTLEGTIFPITNQNQLPFLDVRVHALDKSDHYAANIGGGLRYVTDTNRVFGVNAYYDYRKEHRASYNQLGLGFEFLSEFFNVRLNGYLPIAKRKFRLSRCIFNQYVGDYIIVKDNISKSLGGVDFEVEALLADRNTWGAHVALGTYYFDQGSQSCQKNIFGGSCRLSADFARYFNIGVLVTYDNFFHTRVMGQLGVTIPFSFIYGDDVSFRPQNSREFSRVQRQDLIILNNHCRWFWNY